ncbi:MAG TPA: glycoside hydrolase domain-containing protein [Mariniphaga sp.]|nr:glycoside hydrolase domain-containing protein [Mariniphaga sp.]
MKKYYLAILGLLLLFGCNETRTIKTCETYEEAADPSPVKSDWSTIDGLNYSFASVDKKYSKSEIPEVENTMEWHGKVWKGERISSQLLLWSNMDVDQVEFEFSSFKTSDGTEMDASIATARFVRYVLTDEFADGCGRRKPEDFAVSLSADVLDNVDCFDMKANTTQPVWLSFDIPAESNEGIYNGKLSLFARGEKTKELNIELEVLPQTLPAPQDWEFYLDMWQHPSAVARVNGVEPWSDQHWELLEAPMKMLADAGQKVITATINKDPWNNQCYDPYEDMIIWTKKSDGSWVYDYSIFDKWINFMMDLGVNKVINCYSMIPWNNEIHYIDEASGDTITTNAKPGSKEFIEVWTPFLSSFKQHLQEKGWLKITNIAMDERSPEDMKATITLLEKVAPELGIALADNHKSYKEYPLLKDICLAFGNTFEEEDLMFRKENELISTYYVCCADRFPNIFTFSDPAEAVYIGWYTKAEDFDGFLHWSYNSWTENPLQDSRFRTWPAGDTYCIYPGGRSSIRFERLREGIQDAEKIRILRQKFTNENNTQSLKRLNETVALFNSVEKPENLPALIEKGKNILNELSR